MTPELNGWTEYRKLVLKELEDLNKGYSDLRKEVGKLREDIATLKVKSGVWGMIGGAIPVAIGIIVWFLKFSARG